MEKLKKVINQLNEEQYQEIEKHLTGTKSFKFLSLMEAYKRGNGTDDEIKVRLDCSDNSYYVLKSRLYDKVQKFLLQIESPSSQNQRPDTHGGLIHYLYEYPPETGIAMLKELENKYLLSDSPNDLINVYSALKKAHFYSDKYYTYSQLYNNQVANALAIEKAEEILANFNRTLANYYFSLTETDKGLIGILKKEIANVYSLYKSPRIELILNIITIQAILFTDIKDDDEIPEEDLLEKCQSILVKYGDDKRINYYKDVIAFLQFEYYLKADHFKKAMSYFETVDLGVKKWLLKNNTCMAFKFLLSKTDVFLRLNKKEQIGLEAEEMFLDSNDLYTVVIHKFYGGIAQYFQGKTKGSIVILNDLLNEVSFKNFLYVEIEIKLSLAYFYIKLKEYEMADNVLKSLVRKISTIKTQNFKNVKEAVKMFNILMSGIDKQSNLLKFKNSLEQFTFYNYKERKVLNYLLPELEKLGSGDRA